MISHVISETSFRSPAYLQSVELREAILRHPLGLRFTPEELEREAADYHIVCHEEGQLVGCLVLVPQPEGTIKVRQVAVLPQRQRRGIGNALMSFAEDLARARGFTQITLHAREAAIPFYERLGYQAVGLPFIEVTLPHLKMQKAL